MPLDDRNYMRGSHPPACTCVSCVARRGGYQPGRQVWRGRDITSRPAGRTQPEPANTVRPQGRARPNRAAVPGPGRRKSGGRLMKLVAVIVVAILLWAGLGVWQDYQEQGNFGPERAVAVALNRVISIPSSVAGLIAQIVNASNGRSSLPGEERSQGVHERNRPEAPPANSMSEPAREPLVAPTEALLPAVLVEPTSERTLEPALEPAVAVTVVPEPTATNVPPTVMPMPPSSFAFLVNHPETGVEVALTREQFDEFLATGKMPVTVGLEAPPHSAASRPEPTLTSMLSPAPTPRPAPGLTSAAAELLKQRREHMLGLINEARSEHGYPPVILGSNSAAQQHAEAMLANNFTGHWGIDGLNPNMRYTLAGGTNYMGENVAGAILQAGVDYRPRNAQTSLTKHHQGLMQSPGHRKNILNKWHKKVSLGIACNRFSCAVVQNFEGDYVEFVEKPSISDGVLRFAGELKGDFRFHSKVDIWYDQPTHPLTLGQLDATYSYLVGQEPATFLLGPAPAGSFYSAADLRPTSYFWQAGTDPYTVDPDKPRRSSIPVRASLPVPRSKTVPWTVADTWEIDGTSFRIEADISEVIEDLGPGVYTLFIWGTKGGETVHLTNYSIFLE